MFENTRHWQAPSYISKLPLQEMRASFPRDLVLLGCTGSIGRSTLAVLEALPPEEAALFRVLALAAGRNIELLAKQASLHRPPYLAVQDEALIAPLRALLPAGYAPRISAGQTAYTKLASLPEAKLVLSAQVGASGLRATLAAAKAGKIIALANKESLVLAGDLIREICVKSKAVILPVDSEHNAIFQALMERSCPEPVELVITASGGPFKGFDRAALKQITPAEALKHPNWNMGAKISIDSATLMNKGLEVIEACYLYGLPLEQIEVLVHPQSIVHSAVRFRDGSLLAQMGTPDMRLPIAHCLAWPGRITTQVPFFNPAEHKPLTFQKPDAKTFRCLDLAYQALTKGQGLPIILNAANEIAVEAFLREKLSFLGIADLVEDAMQSLDFSTPRTEDDILELDRRARIFCQNRLTAAG